jgi:heptosyltransferase-3
MKPLQSANTKSKAEFRGVRKILVIKLRYIGDVLLTTPVFTALKENFPDASITALVNSGTESVLAGNPAIDNIIAFDRGTKKLGLASRVIGNLRFLRKVRSMGFDMVVDLSSSDRAAIISFLSGARYRLARDPIGEGFPGKKHLYTHVAEYEDQNHMVIQNLDAVTSFGISAEDLRLKIFATQEDRDYAKGLFDEKGIVGDDFVVLIQPTSRKEFKCWPDEKFAALIDALQGKGAKVVVTGAPSEAETIRSISSLCGLPPMDLGATTIGQLVAVLELADLFIGLDSAPMHIAAAVRTPAIALFGPIKVYHWGPWCAQEPYGYNKESGVQAVGPHVAVQKDWECVPCYEMGCGWSNVSRCIAETEVEEILAHVKFKKKES